MNPNELTPTKCNDAKRWLCGEISLGKLIELSGLKSCHAQAADFAGGIANAMNEQLQASVDRNNQLAAELERVNGVLTTVRECLVSEQKHSISLSVKRDDLQRQLSSICSEAFGNDDTIGGEPADDYVIRQVGKLKRKVERLEKSYVLQRESHEVEIYSWGQRNAQLSRQVEELNAQLKEIVSIKPSRSELAEQNSILRFRISTLEDSTKLRRRLKLAEDEISRHQPELCDEIRMERDHLRAEHTMLKAQNDSLDRELTRRDNENAELLKDKKRLERLMTLERGDLLWFHQERDKRRALDILMEDNE